MHRGGPCGSSPWCPSGVLLSYVLPPASLYHAHKAAAPTSKNNRLHHCALNTSMRIHKRTAEDCIRWNLNRDSLLMHPLSLPTPQALPSRHAAPPARCAPPPAAGQRSTGRGRCCRTSCGRQRGAGRGSSRRGRKRSRSRARAHTGCCPPASAAGAPQEVRVGLACVCVCVCVRVCVTFVVMIKGAAAPQPLQRCPRRR